MNAGILNLDYSEWMLEAFRRDPASVPEEWRRVFQSDFAADSGWKGGPSFRLRSVFDARDGAPEAHVPSHLDPLTAGLHERLNELIRNFRVRGHKIAAIDPLGAPRPVP